MFAHTRMETEDGFELMIGVNYFAPVYLTLLLLDFMRYTSPDPRVMTVASLAHTIARDIQWNDLQSREQLCCNMKRSWHAYGHSKLAITLFSRELARRAYAQGIRVYAVDPGISHTNLITRDMTSFAKTVLNLLIPSPILRTVHESAASIVASVLQERHHYAPDRFYMSDGGTERRLSLPAQSDLNAERLWIMTTQILQSMSAL